MRIPKSDPKANVFALMGLVRDWLSAHGRLGQWPKVEEEMMSNDYEYACDIAEQTTEGWLQVIDDD